MTRHDPPWSARQKPRGCAVAVRQAVTAIRQADRALSHDDCATAEIRRLAAQDLFRRASALCRPCGIDRLEAAREAILAVAGLRERTRACLAR